MLGIYIHFPFCRTLCPYCDFNVHLLRGVDIDAWIRSYESEVAFMSGLRCGVVDTVFFGGGTPSLMPSRLIASILDSIDHYFGLANNVEISLEANPSDACSDYLTELRAAGVTRLSLGIQSLDDDILKFLGRNHDAAMARAAWDSVGQIFEAASFDMIYAHGHHDCARWHDELTQALALGARHMSLYQLTIEAGTAFGVQHTAGRLSLPDETLAIALYQLTHDLCHTAGLPLYEISNHAEPAHICRHNVNIWRGSDYIGLGPGAHGRLTIDGTRVATEIIAAPHTWLQACKTHGHGLITFQKLTPSATYEESLFTGLRLVEGVTKSRLAPDLFSRRSYQNLLAQNFIGERNEHIYAQAQARPVLDSVIAGLIAD